MGRSRTCAGTDPRPSSTWGRPSGCARSGSPSARACGTYSRRSPSPTSRRASCRRTWRHSPPTRTPGRRTERNCVGLPASRIGTQVAGPRKPVALSLCATCPEASAEERLPRRPHEDDLSALQFEPLGLVAGQLHAEALGVVADELDANLEPKV